MLSEKFLDIIKRIYCKLEGSDINWVITGSTAFAIQGIPFTPHDIDIQTDKAGAYAFEKHFEEFVKENVHESSNGKITSHFGKLEIDGVRVEIMGDMQKLVDGKWEDPTDLKKYKKFVDFSGMKLPVLDLDYESKAYQKMGRTEKARILKEWSEKNK